MKRHLFTFFGMLAAASLAMGQPKNFPSQPIKIIVGTGAGTSADNMARHVGQELSVVLGQPVVIDNRPGGDGAIAIMALKNAPADGHSLLVAGNTPIAVNPLVVKDLPYDPVKDLRPVAGLAQSMNVLVVAPGSPINTLEDLITTARKSSQPLNVGTAFMAYYLGVSSFAQTAGVKFNNIPYKATAQVLTDVMGQHLDFGFVDRGVAAPLIKSGKLKALAVTGSARHPDSPDVPTVSESGYPKHSSFAWTALFIRSETPNDTSAKLADALQKVLTKDSTIAFIKSLGVQPMTQEGEALRAFTVQEQEKYRVLVQALGIKPE